MLECTACTRTVYYGERGRGSKKFIELTGFVSIIIYSYVFITYMYSKLWVFRIRVRTVIRVHNSQKTSSIGSLEVYALELFTPT